MKISAPPPLNRSTEPFGPEPFRQAQGPELKAEGLKAEGLTPKSPPAGGGEDQGSERTSLADLGRQVCWKDGIEVDEIGHTLGQFGIGG